MDENSLKRFSRYISIVAVFLISSVTLAVPGKLPKCSDVAVQVCSKLVAKNKIYHDLSIVNKLACVARYPKISIVKVNENCRTAHSHSWIIVPCPKGQLDSTCLAKVECHSAIQISFVNLLVCANKAYSKSLAAECYISKVKDNAQDKIQAKVPGVKSSNAQTPSDAVIKTAG